MDLTKKTPKKSIKTSKNRSDTVKDPHKHNHVDLWDRGSITTAPDPPHPVSYTHLTLPTKA